MSRLVVPIRHQTLWATGDILLWANLDLLLKDSSGGWNHKTFQVDTASQLSTMPAYDAKNLGLPMPAKATPGVTHNPTGLEIRSGLLRFQIIGMDTTEYTVSCLFLGDPDVPPEPNQAALPRNLFQPFSLLDQLRFLFDRNSSPTAIYGIMTVEKKVP